MTELILTAIMVGGATILGGGVGILFRRTSKTFTDGMLSFAAGVMLAAAMVGLILPAVESGGVFISVLGLFIGAICVNLLDMPVSFFSCRVDSSEIQRLRRVLLFVTAIALHNLPEGIAAGVGIGAGEEVDGFLIALAIALQNVPEGIIVSCSMIGVNIRPIKAFAIASLTGVIEIFGCFMGYFAASLSETFLPLVLALAGGTMLYVISEEMIPETHSEGSGRLSTYFLLIGFSLMLIIGEIF